MPIESSAVYSNSPDMAPNSRSTSSYRATEWRDMSFVDLLFFKNRENVAQISEYNSLEVNVFNSNPGTT